MQTTNKSERLAQQLGLPQTNNWQLMREVDETTDGATCVAQTDTESVFAIHDEDGNLLVSPNVQTLTDQEAVPDSYIGNTVVRVETSEPDKAGLHVLFNSIGEPVGIAEHQPPSVWPQVLKRCGATSSKPVDECSKDEYERAVRERSIRASRR